jgi:lysophospholipase L1-like esterase
MILPAHTAPTMTHLEAAGERRLRQLILVIDLLVICAIGAVAIHLWLLPAGANVYFDVQQKASFIYLFSWLVVAGLGALSACHRRTLRISLLLTFILFLEGLAHAYFYEQNGRLYHPWAQEILQRFEPHPMLVGIPHPGRFGALSHDANHRRTTINEGKIASPKHVYAFGGSTTYDVAVGDEQTWASDLSRLLGPSYDVENYGVPGYSSLEALVQSLFVFRDVKPVCAIYYMGGNDLVTAHVEGLENDYSDFHLPGLIGILGVGYKPGLIESNVLFIQLIARAFSNEEFKYGRRVVHGQISDQEDLRLSQIYSENLKLTADIDRHFGVKAIFVPQVLPYDSIEQQYQQGWWPFVSAKGVRPQMRALNADMQQAAKDSGAIFLSSPLAVDWSVSDFADHVHFSAAGAAKFAHLIAPDLARECQ